MPPLQPGEIQPRWPAPENLKTIPREEWRGEIPSRSPRPGGREMRHIATEGEERKVAVRFAEEADVKTFRPEAPVREAPESPRKAEERPGKGKQKGKPRKVEFTPWYQKLRGPKETKRKGKGGGAWTLRPSTKGGMK